MAKKFYFVFLIIISFLFSKSFSKLNIDETSIVITNEIQSEKITHENNIHLFSAEFDKSLGKFIFLYLVQTDYENEFNHIFVSIPGDSETIPSYKESDYKAIDKNTSLLIETSNIDDNVNTAKITIECKESCDFTIYYQIVTTIPLIDDRSFDLILNGNEEFVLEFNKESTDDLNNKFTFFSNAPSDFLLKITYNDTETISPLTDFYNGYGLFINNELYPDGGKFTFKLSHYQKPNELIHISNRKLTKDIKSLAIGDFHNSITGITNLEKECFNLPKISEEENDKNYNLNFMTYTKNILLTFDNQEKYEITAESDIIQINAKQFSEICFSSTNGKIATTTFQILDGTEQTKTQDMQMPLYRGVPKKSRLLKGQIAYYRLYFYPSYSHNLIMNLKSIEGKTKLYYGICSNYPNCDFQENQLSQLETEKDMNNNFMIKKAIETNMTKPYSDPQFQVAVVYCENIENEKDCEYYITISCNNDDINIIENERYYSSLEEYQIDKYQFTVNDPNKEFKSLYINLYSFTGEGFLYIYSDKEMTQEITSAAINSLPNQEIALILANDLPDKTLDGNYYVKVKGLSNTIYNIYYYLEKESTNIYLSSNEVNIKAVKLNQEVSYFIKNTNIHKNLPFIFEYNSLNCDLEVSLTGETEVIKERYYQYIIDPSKSYYTNDYEMKIKAINADIKGASSDFICLVAITGGEVEENKEIVLNDGVIQKGKLSKNIYYNYLYLFMANKVEEEINLFFQKDSNYIIDLSYSFGNSDLTTYKVVNNEKSFVFTKSEFIDKCKNYNDFCALKIKIKINEEESILDNSYIDFSLIVNNKITYPSYLPKDKLVKNVLQTNQYQYYYLDIGENEECDINIDFKEGTGQAIAKIVGKDEIEDNSNYMRRVLLPIPGMDHNYIFDQYKKELKITKEMTSKCVKGCEIYIAVFHIDQRFIDYTSSFTIHYKKNDNIIYLPENIFVHGNLNSIEDKVIYRTKISQNADIITFNLIGEHMVAYINKGESIPTSTDKDYVLDTDNEKEIIIKPDSFEVLTYVITAKKLENKYYRSYDIKIDTSNSESLNFKYVDYLNNNPCYFNKNNKKCNYLLPIEKYNKEKKIYLFTPDSKNTYIYANSFTMEEYDSFTTEQKIENLPKKSTDSKDYLIFDISNRIKEIYIIITVEASDSENDYMANLIIGGYYHSSTSFLRPKAYSFYSIINDNLRNNLNLAIESQDLYQLNFVFLSGEKGIISQSQLNKVFNFSQDLNNTYTFLFNPELKNDKLFTINFGSNNVLNENEELCFYTYLETKTNESNIVNIKYSDVLEQKFEFLESEEIRYFFPLSFYEFLPKNVNEDKQFIFQIYDKLPVDLKFSDKNLIIDGYIINKTSLEDIKINPDNINKENILLNGTYDQNTFTSWITFSKDVIKNYSIYDENYFYINIRNTKEDIFEYNYIGIDLLKSSFNFAGMNKYSTFKIKEKQNKNLLLLPHPRVSFMAIEIFVTGKADLRDYSISVRTYSDDISDYSRNDSVLIEDTNTHRANGKQYMMIYLKSEYHYIVANVIKNNYNDQSNESYMIRYRIAESYPTYFFLSNDRTITYELNGDNLKMTFNGIRECEKGCTLHDDFKVIYIIKFYNKEKIGNEEIKNIIVDEEYLYEYSISKFGGDETSKKVDWKVNVQKYNKIEQLVQIVGYASYADNEEIFSYNTFNVKYEGEEEDDDEDDEEKNKDDNRFKFRIILFCFVLIIIITFGAMYVYIYTQIEIGRRTLMLNSGANAISLIQSPSYRSTGNTNPRMTV